jgi:DNA-binding transcriptional ArsR family regulator
MSRPCSICAHTERLEIDRLLLQGTSYRDIAGRFGLSKTAISRHKESHIGTDLQDVREAMIQAREEALAQIKEETLETIKEEVVAEARETTAARLETAASYLDQLILLRQKAADILEEAAEAGDLKTAIAGIREARACIETLARIEGQLSDAPQITIINSPEWVEVRTVIIQALDPYPQAKEAVVNAIRGR